MSGRSLIDISLGILNVNGFIKQHNDKWAYGRLTVTILVLSIGYVDVLASTVYSWNEPDSMENVFATFGFSEIIIKLFMLLLQRSNILATLDKIKGFWPTDKFGPKQQQISDGIFSKTTFYIRSLLFFLCFLFVAFVFKPLVDAKKKLPYGTYLFRSKEHFQVGYFSQIVVMACLMPIQLGFGIFYVVLLTNMMCEFKLLKEGFSQIPIELNSATERATMEFLVKLIEHHNLILDCSKSIKNIYKLTLFGIFLCDMCTIGITLLCLIANESVKNNQVTVIFGAVLVYYVFQLFLYCYPGTLLILESTGISDVVMNTDWWIKTQPELRRSYVMILQRANKAEILTAGGMINVNLQGFTAIMKSAVSFFTFMRAMYKN